MDYLKSIEYTQKEFNVISIKLTQIKDPHQVLDTSTARNFHDPD